MAIEVEATLRDTRNRLQELGEAVETLVASYPDVFDDPEIASQLEGFRQARQDAANRLDAPSLCLATIGTTSSGKSTIVNALIGRKVAPIEAGEMSGGVLTLQHSDEQKLVVEATEGAVWETGDWSGLNDEELYNRIRGVMILYHEIRRKQKNCMAPEVTAFCPLLPVCDRNLLGLPPSVGVEFIDLPGLKSVQDRANLAVIQKRVHKAFSLVALDYMQVDDEHRKRLLEELKRVVQYLQGRTDSMIFILNRVDQRGADDIPISERINKLQAEIQEVLSLKEPPEIIPFNARLLYYAQCAWGTDAFSEASAINEPNFSWEVLNPLNNINALPNLIVNYANLIKTNTEKIKFWDGSLKGDFTTQNDVVKTQVDPSTRLKLLDAMFQDCAGAIRQHMSDNRELRRWFHGIEEQVADGKTISDATMQQILHYAREWSGGNALWSRLRTRVQESFPELVILPALVDVFDEYDALSKAINTLVKIHKIERKEEVKLERKRLSESRQRLHEEVEEIHKNFCAGIKKKIELLKKNTTESRSLVAQRAQAEGLQGFQLLIDAIDEVEGDLTQVLIAPVRDALKNNQGVYDLEEKLREVVTPALAHDIARAYDICSRKLDSFTHTSGNLVKRVRKEAQKEVRDLENAERAVRKLYQAMREALSARSEFTLQAQVKKLENTLQGLVEKEVNALFDLCVRELPSFKLGEAIITDFKKKVSRSLPSLPENLFELPTPINQRHVQQEEVVGKKKETEYYTTGTCFKSEHSKEVTRDVKGIIEYHELSLPDADTMARQWGQGIAKAKQGLWDVLCAWITNRLDLTSSVFDQSVDDLSDLADRALQEQLGIIKQNLAQEMQCWSEIEARKALVTALRQKLEEESRTS